MRVWGVHAATAVLLFAFVAPLLLVPMVGLVYHRYARLAPLPSLGVAAAIFYALTLLAVTILPLPADQAAACSHPGAGWHLVPFRAFAEAWTVAGKVGPVAFLTSWTFLQLVMNVVLLIPLGLLVGWRSSRPVWVAAAGGLATSLTIEMAQGSGLFGLYDCAYRYAEFDDILTNTAGAVIGWFIGRAIARRIPWPTRFAAEQEPEPGRETRPEARPETRPERPRVGRRVLAVLLDALGFVLTSALVQIVVLLLAQSFGWFGAGDPYNDAAVIASSTVIPALILFVVVPLTRSDRATVGQVAVLLTVRAPDAGSVGRRRVLLRIALRWWTVLVFIAAPERRTGLLLVAWIVAEVVTVAVRPDRRSLPDLVSGLTLVARPPRPGWWRRTRRVGDAALTS